MVMEMGNASPSAPSRFRVGTRQSSKERETVQDPFKPILCSGFPTEYPGIPGSTRKALIRFFGSFSVTAMTMVTPAREPVVMNPLLPFRTYASPSRRATVEIPKASDPAEGSVSANAPVTVPEARAGRDRPLPPPRAPPGPAPRGGRVPPVVSGSLPGSAPPHRSVRPSARIPSAPGTGPCPGSAPVPRLPRTAMALVLQESRGDHQPLDFRCPLVDLGDFRVAEMPLRRIFLDVAVPAVDLDPLHARPHRGLGGVQFRHGRFLRVPDVPVFEPGRPVGEKPRGVDLRGHVGEHPLDRLEIHDRLRALPSFLGVGEGGLA